MVRGLRRWGAKLRHFKLDEYRNILDKGQIQDICKDADPVAEDQVAVRRTNLSMLLTSE